MNNITVSFEGLGIGSFELNSVAFTIPIGKGIDIMWYGVIIAFGMICAITYYYFRSKTEGIKFDDIIDVALFAIPIGVIGARLYYVLFKLENFHSLWDVINIRDGGLAIYGGIIFGSLTVFIMCKYIKKINLFKFFDVIGPGVMLAQAIGRWGNFMNGEAYGGIVSESSPLYFLRMGLAPNIYSYSQIYYFHPTFLYESLWNILGFVLINVFYKKKIFDGQNFLYYIGWYGLGRMFIEGLRTDSLYIGSSNIRVSQLLALLLFLGATGLIIYGIIKTKKEKKNGSNN